MKIASWNVNSVRAREERLLRWLGAHAPDVLCLQELKVKDDLFPWDAVRAAGYHAAVHGQKTYNGVAILARSEPTEVVRGFGDGSDDAPARFLAARV
ncbi:MAG TPA: exodeoxyribonuclease III, partial [Vicinamibacteria bacterium]